MWAFPCWILGWACIIRCTTNSTPAQSIYQTFLFAIFIHPFILKLKFIPYEVKANNDYKFTYPSIIFRDNRANRKMIIVILQDCPPFLSMITVSYNN